MATITIDGKNYDLESLSSEAHAQISSLKAVDQELNYLQSKIAMTQTARNAYAKSLAQKLPETASRVSKNTVSIDGKPYNLTKFSDEAKNLLATLKMVDGKIVSLQDELALHQTARITYANALKNDL